MYEYIISYCHALVSYVCKFMFLNKYNFLCLGQSVDSGLEAESVDHVATYVFIESQDRLELTVSPVALQVLTDLTASFSRQTPVITQKSPPLLLVNDIAPNSTVMLFSKAEVII